MGNHEVKLLIPMHGQIESIRPNVRAEITLTRQEIERNSNVTRTDESITHNT
jgi:hypothetical protein